MKRKMIECEHKNMEVRANQFYWRGKYFTGLVCGKCNSLFDNPDDSFLGHASGQSQTYEEKDN